MVTYDAVVASEVSEICYDNHELESFLGKYGLDTAPPSLQLPPTIPEGNDGADTDAGGESSRPVIPEPAPSAPAPWLVHASQPHDPWVTLTGGLECPACPSTSKTKSNWSAWLGAPCLGFSTTRSPHAQQAVDTAIYYLGHKAR